MAVCVGVGGGARPLMVVASQPPCCARIQISLIKDDAVVILFIFYIYFLL